MDYFGLSLLIGSFIFGGLWFFGCLKEKRNSSNKNKASFDKTSDEKIEVQITIESPSSRYLEPTNPLAKTFKNLNEYLTETSLNKKFAKSIAISFSNYMDRKVFKSEKKRQKDYKDFLNSISETCEAEEKALRAMERRKNIDKIREQARLELEEKIAELKANIEKHKAELSPEQKITEAKKLSKWRLEYIKELAEMEVKIRKEIREKHPPEIAEEMIERFNQMLAEERGMGL